MLWLERPPILRWLAAGCLVALAAWSELAPPPTTTMAFLVDDVPVGTRLGPEHIEYREVPAAPIETVEPSGVATANLKAGEPLVTSMVSEASIPGGWFLIEAPVPAHAAPGAAATGIILADGSAPVEFDARVVEGGNEDPFGAGTGTVAVPPEWVGAAAAAASDNRLVIGVETTGR